MIADTLKERKENCRILLNSLDLSPFELQMGFSLRSELEDEKDKMSKEMVGKLNEYDRIILNNLEAYKQHIAKVHDFENAGYPRSHWWWHLDKI